MRTETKSKARPSSAPLLPSVENGLLDRHIHHLREYHRAAMMAANQTTAAAIFTGLELLAVQAELKKCNRCTFENWLDQHQDEIGFSRRTAFNYTALARGMKTRMGAIEPLLAFAPSDLNNEQQKRLLKAMHKSVDGESITELYLDFGIVKKKRKVPVRLDPANNGAGASRVTDEEVLIQEEFYDPINEVLAFAEKTITRGDARISKLALIPKDRWLSHRAELQKVIAQGDAIHGIKEARP